jgi:hypothetical protein
MTNKQFQEQLKSLLEKWQGTEKITLGKSSWNRHHRSIEVYMREAIRQMSFLVRDDEIKQLSGKDYFEAKDGVNADSKLKPEPKKKPTSKKTTTKKATIKKPAVK